MNSLILRAPIAIRKSQEWTAMDEFENLVERFFSSYQPYQGEEGLLQMPVELVERDNNLILNVMVPGMKKEDINIEVSENQVSISGVCKVEYDENKDLIHRSEFCKGNFSRVISLPQLINHQKAKAEYKDGILTLTLPISEKETHKIVKLTL